MFAGCTYNNLCKLNVRFRDITRRMVSMLPSMFFSDGGKLAIVSVRSLTKKFGSPSGAVLEVRRIVPSPNQAINVGWVYDFVVWEGLSSSTYLGEKSQKSHFIKI